MSIIERKYDHSYIVYGFTSIMINGEERPQCVICCKALTNDSMKPAKMMQHLQNVHPQHKDKKNILDIMGMLSKRRSWFQQKIPKKKKKLVSTEDFKEKEEAGFNRRFQRKRRSWFQQKILKKKKKLVSTEDSKEKEEAGFNRRF